MALLKDDGSFSGRGLEGGLEVIASLSSEAMAELLHCLLFSSRPGGSYLVPLSVICRLVTKGSRTNQSWAETSKAVSQKKPFLFGSRLLWALDTAEAS